jgi:hypothetical protein
MAQSFSLYQLLVPLFAVLMIAKAVSQFFRHRRTLRELFVLCLIWSGVSLVAIFPDFSMHWLSLLTGIKSGFNALIFFNLVVLVYGFLQLLIKMEDNERILTELVRKIALSELSKRTMPTEDVDKKLHADDLE